MGIAELVHGVDCNDDFSKVEARNIFRYPILDCSMSLLHAKHTMAGRLNNHTML